MPRPIVFRYAGTEVAFQLNKVDRSRLYGTKEREVLDDDGRTCEMATIADDGRTVIGKGGTGLGYVSADGEWCSKSDLKPVDLEGEAITPVKSSFDSPIELDDTVPVDEYLTHNIRLVYWLDAEDVDDDLEQKLADGEIFSFPYSYRGGLQADAAFLMQGDDGHHFLAVGDPTNLRMVGLQQTASVAEEESDSAEEGDFMDFDMI